MACPNRNNCELFPYFSRSNALLIWHNFYCDGNYETCKRYQSELDGKAIPLSLLPNGKTFNPVGDDIDELTKPNVKSST